MSLYEVDWFVEDIGKDKRSSIPQLPPLNASALTRLSVTSRRHSISLLPRDVENQLPVSVSGREKPLPSPVPSNVWWGRVLPGRAGKDHPFNIRRVKRPEFQWQDDEGGLGYGYSQQAPSMQVPSPAVSQPSIYPPTTEVVLNEDEPIPLGDRAQWVRALKISRPYVPPITK